MEEIDVFRIIGNYDDAVVIFYPVILVIFFLCMFFSYIFILSVFTEPRYPEIKEMVCLFINKYKVFPDYQDIHSIVEKCNVQHSLNMS